MSNTRINPEITRAFEHVVHSRRSVRGFLPQPVPDDILKKVFTLARQSPSNCNTQPWHVYVVSGEKCESLRKILPGAMMKMQISMDFPYDGKYDGEYKLRQYDSAARLYGAMGITRDEKGKRNDAFFRNFTFFDAPHAAFIFIPEQFGIREAADIGMFAQTLMLAMTAHGIASCPQTALSFHADIVRDILDIDPALKLLLGISFGYEDTENKANKCRVGRAGLEESIHFIK